MKKLLAHIDGPTMAAKLTAWLKEEVIWKVEKNEYGIVTSKVMVPPSKLNQLNRRTLANQYYMSLDVKTNSLIRAVNRVAIDNDLELVEVEAAMNLILAKEIDYRLARAYAAEYVGKSTAKVLMMNVIESSGLVFKYNSSKEKFQAYKNKYTVYKEELTKKIKKNQVSFLSGLLAREDIQLAIPIKTLDESTADHLIKHLTVGTPIDEATQRMLIQ